MKTINTNLDKVRASQFHQWSSGKLKAGIRHWVRTDLGLEDHECYQYSTVEELVDAVRTMRAIEGMKKIEIVTYDYNDRTERRVTKVLYAWIAEGQA